MAVLSLENICFSYQETAVLKDLSLSFEQGKMYCIMGKSGAGKTTLLSVLSGLAAIQSGTIRYEGKDIRELDPYRLRSRYIGVIFQNYNLITRFTALENVLLSMEIAGLKEKKARALELLNQVGLTAEEGNRPVLKLSGGQQQRVAIARALSFDPKVILADEPTGNLDPETQEAVMDIFASLAQQGKCVIIVSHAKDVAKRCDEVYQLPKLG